MKISEKTLRDVIRRAAVNRLLERLGREETGGRVGTGTARGSKLVQEKEVIPDQSLEAVGQQNISFPEDVTAGKSPATVGVI